MKYKVTLRRYVTQEGTVFVDADNEDMAESLAKQEIDSDSWCDEDCDVDVVDVEEDPDA